MEEPKPIQVAQIYDQEQNPMNGRVYDADGIAPTLRTPMGGLSEPKIMQISSYSPSSACNAKVLDPDGISPTLLDHKGAEPAVVEPTIIQRPHGYFSGGETDIAPTVKASAYADNNFAKEPIKIRQATAQGYIECPPGGGFDAAYPNSKLRRGRVQQNGDVVGALTASADNHCVYEGKEMSPKADHHNAVMERYRIRKLTPRECFRLMDMDDADIDKIDAYRIRTTLKSGVVKEKPISKSAKYKCAGNSICVGVLYHIFRCMFIPNQPEYDKRKEPKQLSLFDI